MLFTETDNPI